MPSNVFQLQLLRCKGLQLRLDQKPNANQESKGPALTLLFVFA